MNLLPHPDNLYFRWFACSVAFIFPFAYLYSLALIRGIASARDEQHRMTPLSPWFYFWMKSKRILILTACLAPPWLLVANALAFGAVFAGISNAWNQVILWGDERPLFILLYLGIYGLASLIFATITRIAPRISSPLLLTTFGLSLGIPVWGILFSAAFEMSASAFEGFALLTLFTLLGILSLILTWLHVRFRLNRAWFRLNDS